MKTEIYGTLGPACDDEDLLYEMFRRGMTGMRLNMSHSGLPESADMIARYHAAARRSGKKGDLLIDLQGPELRIGDLETPVIIKTGEDVLLGLSLQDHGIPIPASVLQALRKDDRVLLDDGRVELSVTEIEGQRILCRAERGGTLTSRKSIKIIGKGVEGPALTASDLENIACAKQYGVTAVMEPFVHNGQQLRKVRSVLDEHGCGDVRLFAKIEDLAGAENLEDIVPYADMIVIARGDLGNDMPLWQLPSVCMRIEDVCRRHGVPFLMVTQMLTSMIHTPVPTRAEVSDIFHAVAEGASAVMVTNETAVGMYPGEVIRYLSNTAASAEEYREGNNADQSV